MANTDPVCAFEFDRSGYPVPSGYTSGCQFSGLRHLLTPVGDKFWCPFHLPKEHTLDPSHQGKLDNIITRAFSDPHVADFSGAVFRRDVNWRTVASPNERCPPLVLFVGTTFCEDTVLSGCGFQGKVFFDDSRMEKRVISDKSRFHAEVSFRNCVFLGTVNFEHSEFKDSSFSNSRFMEITHLNNIRFIDKLLFSGVTFENDIIFNHSIFENSTSFDDQAKFHKSAAFIAADFNGLANFRGAQFLGAATFEGGASQREMSFYGVRFREGASFASRAMQGLADFREAVFEAGISCEGTNFAGRVCFSEARFLSSKQLDAEFPINFHEARFTREAEFRNARFEMAVDFSVSVATEGAPGFSRRVVFDYARFKGPARFNNRGFKDVASFIGVVFEKAPDFDRCYFHRGSTFTGVKALEVNANVEGLYRGLRQQMRELGARIEEGTFFVLEQRCRRKAMRGWNVFRRATRGLSFMYDLTASYGESIWRPLIALLVFVGLTWLGFEGVARYAAGVEIPSDRLLGFAFEQIVRPFFIWQIGEGSQRAHWACPLVAAAPAAMKGLGTLLTVVGLGYLAIFLIALRRRFALHTG